MKDTPLPKSWQGRTGWPGAHKALGRESREEREAPIDAPPCLKSPFDIPSWGLACLALYPWSPNLGGQSRGVGFPHGHLDGRHCISCTARQHPCHRGTPKHPCFHGMKEVRTCQVPWRLQQDRHRLYYEQGIKNVCNEHGTFYVISSDFGDRMTTQHLD